MKISSQADFAEHRIKSAGKGNLEIARYPGLGHLVDSAYAPPCNTSFHPFLPPKGLLYFGGGDKQVHVMQARKSWNKMISFFKKSLVGV